MLVAEEEVPILTVTLSQIKKAYRKQALLYHPDKAGQSAETTQKFHQIGFAYAVLSDEKRRKRFDDTGRTNESFLEGEADWDAYFRELWSGEVSGRTLDDFVKTYQGMIGEIVFGVVKHINMDFIA